MCKTIIRRRFRFLSTVGLFTTAFLLVLTTFASGTRDRIELSGEEIAWLKAHPVILHAPDPDYAPFEFRDKSDYYAGIAPDFLKLVGQKLGIEFKAVPTNSWAVSLKNVKQHKADLVTVATKTAERSKYMIFTSPYIEFPNVILMREDVSGSFSLKNLEGKSIAAIKGWAITAYIQKKYPKIKLYWVANVKGALEAVSNGTADAVLLNRATAGYWRAKTDIANLRIAGETAYIYKLSFAARKDWPQLSKLLEKALNAISESERKEIVDRWIFPFERPWRPGPKFWIGLAGIVVLLLIACFFVWNLSLQRKVQKRTRDLQSELVERKRVEGALRESEAQKGAILDGITSNLAFVNESLEILWANKASADSVSRHPDEMVGHKCYELWADPNVPCDGCPTAKAFKTRRTEETIMHTPDGRVWDEKGEPVFDENGRIAGVIEIAHEFTGKVKAEEALRESEEKLARARKMEAMGLMAGGVAHDLNNILSGIVSYPELLLMDLPEDSPLRKPIMTIRESGMKAADVVADLLTIARGVATGKQVLNHNTSINEYLGSPEYRELRKMHPSVSFKTDLYPDLLNMRGSPIHIKKTLMNLAINAAEAIEGHGTITISTRNRYLDEPLKGYEDVRAGEYAVLAVSDDGSGISSLDLERIFEPFYTKKMMGRSGTGLGLAVVWNTLQDHDGYIDVESTDKGTVFELYFPVTRDEAADEKEQVPREDYLGHGERILVVDDEESQREIATWMLTRLGYTAEAVSSGEEAIEYLKENQVDLVVLDMIMPKGIDGRETYEEIIKIRPSQKAIIASGYAKTKQVDLAQELGAGKYIKKPYTLERMGVAVKEKLEK